MKVQIKALVGMIQLQLCVFKERERAAAVLTNVANVHSNHGVKAFQYGVFGEVLLWTFGTCLGESFTTELHFAWRRLLSNCLAIILPVAVANDRKKDFKALPSLEQAALARRKENLRNRKSSGSLGYTSRSSSHQLSDSLEPPSTTNIAQKPLPIMHEDRNADYQASDAYTKESDVGPSDDVFYSDLVQPSITSSTVTISSDSKCSMAFAISGIQVFAREEGGENDVFNSPDSVAKEISQCPYFS